MDSMLMTQQPQQEIMLQPVPELGRTSALRTSPMISGNDTLGGPKHASVGAQEPGSLNTTTQRPHESAQDHLDSHGSNNNNKTQPFVNDVGL